MSGPDVWANLWAVCVAYPLQAICLVLIVFALGNVVALCIVSPARPSPDEQSLDDQEQLNAVTRPASLPTHWDRSGGNWWGKL